MVCNIKVFTEVLTLRLHSSNSLYCPDPRPPIKNLLPVPTIRQLCFRETKPNYQSAPLLSFVCKFIF
jgi:hypothetical protein